MHNLIFPAIVLVLGLAPTWPLFFRHWKYRHILLLLNTLLIIGFGGISMLYFQMEKNFSQIGEAMAVTATRDYLADGGDPARLAAKLEAEQQADNYQTLPLRGIMRRWFGAVHAAKETVR